VVAGYNKAKKLFTGEGLDKVYPMGVLWKNSRKELFKLNVIKSQKYER